MKITNKRNKHLSGLHPKCKIKGNYLWDYKNRKWLRIGASIAPGCNSIKYSKNKHYYLNFKHHRWMRTFKGDWKNGPVITMIPLSPEQAVISCCRAENASPAFTKVRFRGPNSCDSFGIAEEGQWVCNTYTGGKDKCYSGKSKGGISHGAHKS